MKLRSVRYQGWMMETVGGASFLLGYVGAFFLVIRNWPGSSAAATGFGILGAIIGLAGTALGEWMEHPSPDEEASYRLTGKYE